MRWWTIVFLFCSVGMAAQGYSPHKKIPAEDLRYDFKLMRSALEEAHPGLYSYHSKPWMDSLFDATLKRIDTSMTEDEFLRFLMPVVAEIRCGHTQLYRPDAYEKWQKDSARMLPIDVHIINGKLYAEQCLTDSTKLPAGAQILSINDIAMDTALPRLMDALSCDGYIHTSKERHLEESFALFDARFTSYYGEADTFRIALRKKGADKEDTVMIPAVHGKVITEQLEKMYPDYQKNWRPVSYDRAGRIAVLSVRSFSAPDFYRAGMSYPRYLKKTFRKIRRQRVRDLIIDLRGNGGGAVEYAGQLYRYIARDTFRVIDRLRVTTKDSRFSFNAVNGVYPDYENIVKTDSGFFLTGHDFSLNVHRPARQSFKRSVYVLIDGESFSATSMFCALAQYHHRAKFVGEETGGTYEGCNGSNYTHLVLPGSRLMIRIPIAKIITAVKAPEHGRGIMPDYPVALSVDDLGTKTDPVLREALRQIKLEGKK